MNIKTLIGNANMAGTSQKRVLHNLVIQNKDMNNNEWATSVNYSALQLQWVQL